MHRTKPALLAEASVNHQRNWDTSDEEDQWRWLIAAGISRREAKKYEGMFWKQLPKKVRAALEDGHMNDDPGVFEGDLHEATPTQWEKSSVQMLNKVESLLNDASEDSPDNPTFDNALRCVLAAKHLLRDREVLAKDELKEVLRSL